MKHFFTISLCFLALSLSVYGQFIPQPMAYNPDENSDGLINVNDLQGLLSLYGNNFNNSDSTIIEFIDFGADCLEYYDDIAINENVDLLYVRTGIGSCGTEPSLILPQGDSFKTLVVFANQYGPVFGSRIDIPPYGQIILGDHAKYKVLVRGHDGNWYVNGW
jgi:hypothetical protein